MPALPLLETDTFLTFIADNDGYGIHRPGYNGVASLIPKATGNNIFVPTYAGLNYETINLTGMPSYLDATGEKFEPRREPMHVASASDQTVVLEQPETSHAHVESRITFTVDQPCTLHQRIEITPHRRFTGEDEPSRFTSLYASYIHTPRDRHIYLRPGGLEGEPDEGWYGLTKADHAASETDVAPLPRSVHGPEGHLAAMQGQDTVTLPDAPDLDAALKQDLSFYYGLLDGGLVFLMMFRRPETFRLAYSPCGGGQQPAWSPAWDYVLHADDVQVGSTYTWELALAVKPFLTRADILDDVRRFQGNQGLATK